MRIHLLTCVALLLFLGVSANAAEAKPYPLTTCIVSDDKLDSAVSLVHNGQLIKLCCKSCVKKFQANPDKYLIKLPKK